MSHTQTETLHGYPHDKVAELKEVFTLLDGSGDGLVQLNEVKALMLFIIPLLNEEKYEAFIKECQLSDCKEVSFAQFFMIVTKMRSVFSAPIQFDKQKISLADITDAFAAFDPNKDGYIDENIFMALMTQKGDKLSEAEATELRLRVERMGLVRNGKVNYSAFISNLTRVNDGSAFV